MSTPGTTQGSTAARGLPARLLEAAWVRREALGGEFLRLFALLALFLVNCIGYPTVARIAEWRGVTAWDPTTALDHWIPALPWTIAIYSTLYLYLPVGIFAAPRCDAGRWELLVHVRAQTLIVAVSYAFFLLLPAEIHLAAGMRPLVEESPAWIRALFALVYLVDRPWNAWPSLHVSQSLLVVLCVQRWTSADFEGRRSWLPSGAARPPALALLWACWAALALSILTTKQHFVWDGITGTLLGLAAWRFAFRPLVPAARKS